MTIAAARQRLFVLPRWEGGEWVIAGHVARRSLVVAAIWGLVFGLYVLATVQAYVRGFPTHAERLQLVHSLQSFAIMLGPLRQVDTVPGFVAWRVLTAAAIISGIWGLLTSTGLLRGEEDAGRWELLLAGQTTKRWAAAQALLGLGVGFAVLYGVTALLTAAAGSLPAAHFSLGGSLLFAVALVSGGGMFLAIGALASQLSASRGQAAMISAGVLGISYVVRMLADSSTALAWLRWVTPLGWIEELHPLVDPRPVALIPIVGLVLVCSGLTIVLAGQRDLYASALRESESRSSNARWLIGPTSLAIYLSRTVGLAWIVGIVGFSILMGSVARAAAGVFTSSPTFAAALGRLGVRSATQGYVSFALFLIGVFITVLAASQVGAMRDEEATGRIDHLLVLPVRRVAWLGGRLLVAMSLVFLTGLAAGFATWIGAATHHTYAPLPGLLAAGINASVPGFFVLGAGVLVFGVRPAFTSAAAYGVVAWSFLVDLLGSFLKGYDWLRDSSVFTHIKLAPEVNPDWGTDAVIILLGAGMAVLGALAFHRRDIEYA